MKLTNQKISQILYGGFGLLVLVYLLSSAIAHDLYAPVAQRCLSIDGSRLLVKTE